MPKLNDAEREYAVATVHELWLAGVRIAKMREALASKGISVTERQIYRYLKKIRSEVRTEAKFSRDEQFGRSVRRCENIYARGIANGDLRSALRAQQELNRLFGLIRRDPKGDGLDFLEDFIRKGLQEKENGDGENEQKTPGRLLDYFGGDYDGGIIDADTVPEPDKPNNQADPGNTISQ